jgi:hypothetical protein
MQFLVCIQGFRVNDYSLRHSVDIPHSCQFPINEESRRGTKGSGTRYCAKTKQKGLACGVFSSFPFPFPFFPFLPFPSHGPLVSLYSHTLPLTLHECSQPVVRPT